MILNIQSRLNTLDAYSPASDFGAYLHISKDQQFVLDLSQSTILEILDERKHISADDLIHFLSLLILEY